jgi:hypothetical protein
MGIRKEILLAYRILLKSQSIIQTILRKQAETKTVQFSFHYRNQ